MGSDDEYMRQLEAQRAAFEAQFGSLEDMGYEDKTKVEQESEESEESGQESEHDDEDDSDDGMEMESGNEEEEEEEESKEEVIAKAAPKVIKFNDPSGSYEPPSKQEQKLLRSGKAPKHTLLKDLEDLKEAQKRAELAGETEESENLKNDIELQNFIKESHILANFNSFSGAELTLKTIDGPVIGKARTKTLEMRMKQASSVNGKGNKLEKVPMNIRKGMIDNHKKKIAKYEQDAREGGIILSKVKKGEFRKIDATYKKDIERRIGTSTKARDAENRKKRDRGLQVGSKVGRSTRNGLVISQAEIQRINNSGIRKKKGGKGRR